MRWNHYIAYFFGGAFLANAIPHFVSGIMGIDSKAHLHRRRAKACLPQW